MCWSTGVYRQHVSSQCTLKVGCLHPAKEEDSDSFSMKALEGLCNNPLGLHIMHIYIKFACFLLLVPCPIFPLTVYTENSCIMQITQEDLFTV